MPKEQGHNQDKFWGFSFQRVFHKTWLSISTFLGSNNSNTYI